MRKWCPEPLDVARDSATDAPSFQADDTVAVSPDGDSRFEKDPGLAGHTSLWDLMNEGEREELLDRARETLSAEIALRENETEARHAAALAEARAEYDARMDIWSREFSLVHEQDRKALAAEAAGLALAVARKIIRDTVAEDSGVLVRTLETALYKIQDSHPLTVILNPNDAERLSADPALMTRLRVKEVVPDRRIEPGGCRVRAGLREWDATITRQLDTLAAVVEESFTAAQEAQAESTGDIHDPGLQ